MRPARIGDVALYRMMSDETRLSILKMLSAGEMSVGDIIEETRSPQPLVSHKLKDLRENGLVVSYRSGKNVIYRLSDSSISSLLKLGEGVGDTVKNFCQCVECEETPKS